MADLERSHAVTVGTHAALGGAAASVRFHAPASHGYDHTAAGLAAFLGDYDVIGLHAAPHAETRLNEVGLREK